MFIQISTGGNALISVNVNQIMYIEPGHSNGTFIHLSGMPKIHCQEDFFDLEKRLKAISK